MWFINTNLATRYVLLSTKMYYPVDPSDYSVVLSFVNPQSTCAAVHGEVCKHISSRESRSAVRDRRHHVDEAIGGRFEPLEV